MMEKFYPDEYLDSTYEIDFDELYAQGYRGVIFDIDNTLVRHGAPADERACALFAHLKELGFDFRDLNQANVDMTKFKSVYERATKLEDSIANKSKYSWLIDSLNGIKASAAGCEGDVTDLSARLSNLEVEASRCGATTETLGQKLSRLFKEHFQTAIAMAGVAMIKQGLREVYNNVVDIDTSMTNLKKVTNETESAYSSFLSSASSQARELGASISDVIDSTAEWSRLGYTLDESQELVHCPK